jgi:hypothetical protein
MANTQAMCTSFLGEVLTATHNFTTGTGNTFKAALYTATANTSSSTTLCASVTAYAATVNTVPEVSGTNYSAGGVAITNGTSPLSTNSSTTAGVGYWTPTASITYTNVTLSTAFDTVLIYNSSASNKAVSVHTFGSQTVTAGTFTLTMPSNTTTTALLRLATT